MADTFDVLGQGQAPTTMAAVYTVPASTDAIVKALRVTNTASASATVSIGINGTADLNLIVDSTVMQVGDRGIDDTISLGDGDTITMASDKPSAISYTVMGLQVT